MKNVKIVIVQFIIVKRDIPRITSTLERGLNTHIKQMHNTVQKDSVPYPKKCDVCDKDIDSKHEMKIHMKSHSYIKSEYKCEKCEFICERELTMEVHLGKYHDENFECGLCSFVANSQEKLNLHLVTCEIYICDRCHIRHKTISELKTHYKDDSI